MSFHTWDCLSTIFMENKCVGGGVSEAEIFIWDESHIFFSLSTHSKILVKVKHLCVFGNHVQRLFQTSKSCLFSSMKMPFKLAAADHNMPWKHKAISFLYNFNLALFDINTLQSTKWPFLLIKISLVDRQR